MSSSVSSPSHVLDVRDKTCPLTFVHAKVLVENMDTGERAQILYSETESKRLPESLSALDIEIQQIQRSETDTGWVLWLQKQ